MKKAFLSLILAAPLFASVAFAEEKGIPVAVFDLNTTEDALVGTAEKITALLTANLSADPRFILLERVELTKSIQELSLGLSGTVNAEDAAKVGHMSGAKVLVTGQVFKHGKDQIVFMADIIGTETSRLYIDTVSTHFPARRHRKPAAILQTVDTEKFKMGWLIVAFDLPVGTKKQRRHSAPPVFGIKAKHSQAGQEADRDSAPPVFGIKAKPQHSSSCLAAYSAPPVFGIKAKRGRLD